MYEKFVLEKLDRTEYVDWTGSISTATVSAIDTTTIKGEVWSWDKAGTDNKIVINGATLIDIAALKADGKITSLLTDETALLAELKTKFGIEIDVANKTMKITDCSYTKTGEIETLNVNVKMDAGTPPAVIRSAVNIALGYIKLENISGVTENIIKQVKEFDAFSLLTALYVTIDGADFKENKVKKAVENITASADTLKQIEALKSEITALNTEIDAGINYNSNSNL